MFSLRTKNAFKMNQSERKFNYLERIIEGLREPKNLYDVLLPLHFLTKCMGLSPQTHVVTDGKIKYEPSALGVAYGITVMLMFVGYYVYAVETRDDPEDSNKIVRGIDMYHLYGSITVMALAIFLNGYYQKMLIKALQYIVDCDNKMLSYSCKINWKMTRNAICAYLLTIMTILSSFEYMNCTMFLREMGTLSTYCFLMCLIPMIINGFVEAQFIIYILLLRQRFAILNAELRSLTFRKKYLLKLKLNKIAPIKSQELEKPITKVLVEARQIHSKLCEIGFLLNKYYSLQILLDTANLFVHCTTLAYYCFDGCMKLYMNKPGRSVYNTATTGVWTLAKLSQMFLLTLSCSLVKKEAKSAGEIIYNIDGRYEPELAPEIYSFGKQIIHWNFKFTAFDFFEIDMTLFYSAVCSATTYLMILIQLDIANKQIEQSMQTIQVA